ncbi:hypothetical protein ACPPVO_33865 [Dactylosporangium sp. McL0621]|uniref:hypothetical protein n=1 Tax=Dactylosporangium sp. McL0621 TaxID=3415678 RepID=UPI003CEBE6D6
MTFVDDHDVAGDTRVLQLVEDRYEVVVGEPAGDRGQPEGLVDRARAERGKQLDGLVHLRLDPGRATGASLDQPPAGAFTQSEERNLLRRSGPWSRPGQMATRVDG